MNKETAMKSGAPELSIVLGGKPATTARPSPEDVAQAAYFAWERAGKPEGCGEKFWLEAEAQLRANGGAAKATRKNGRTHAAA